MLESLLMFASMQRLVFLLFSVHDVVRHSAVDTRGKFVAIVYNGGKICHRYPRHLCSMKFSGKMWPLTICVNHTGGAPWLAHIREFSKKIRNDTNAGNQSGAWGGRWFMNKPEAKILVTLSLLKLWHGPWLERNVIWKSIDIQLNRTCVEALPKI